MSAYSQILTAAQINVLADLAEPRMAAVLGAFGLKQAGATTATVQRDPERFNEVLVVKIPFRRREAV